MSTVRTPHQNVTPGPRLYAVPEYLERDSPSFGWSTVVAAGVVVAVVTLTYLTIRRML